VECRHDCLAVLEQMIAAGFELDQTLRDLHWKLKQALGKEE
jgi:hypothetical protein